jgi:spoIIIJ-associated protein
VSQAEDKLNDVPGEQRSAIVSTDSAETAAAEENPAVNGPATNGTDGPAANGADSSEASLDAADLDTAAEDEVADDEDADDPDDDGDVDDEPADAESDEVVASGEEKVSVSLADLEQEGEIAADYVEGLLDIADLDGDIDMDVEGSRALVSVVGATLDELVGRRGEVLEALQELTRLAVHRQTGERARLMLDVGGYRARRRAELSDVGRDAADEVKRTGTPKHLPAMTPFERKVVHGAVADAGLRSESEGEEPNRRVVVYPAE